MGYKVDMTVFPLQYLHPEDVPFLDETIMHHKAPLFTVQVINVLPEFFGVFLWAIYQQGDNFVRSNEIFCLKIHSNDSRVHQKHLLFP